MVILALHHFITLHIYMSIFSSFFTFSSTQNFVQTPLLLEEQFKFQNLNYEQFNFLESFDHALYLAATKCDGNREEQFPPGNLFVAVSEGLWDNGAACGRRYRLRCLSGPNRPCKHRTIDVKVVDFCPVTPCPSTIMLSRDAFAAIAHHGRKINIEYIQ